MDGLEQTTATALSSRTYPIIRKDEVVQGQVETATDEALSECSSTISNLVENLQQVQVGGDQQQSAEIPAEHLQSQHWNPPMTLVCDMGYGLPRESRPRKEKLLAIARQLVNFLEWQHCNQHCCPQCHLQDKRAAAPASMAAKVQVVACPDATVVDELESRMLVLWNQSKLKCSSCGGVLPCDGVKKDERLPCNFCITTIPLEDWIFQTTTVTRNDTVATIGNNDFDDKDPNKEDNSIRVVYLSPDAADILNINDNPPHIVIVGLIIDRKHISVNRSNQRASMYNLQTARWPLEQLSTVSEQSATGLSQLDCHEPLNVDCVLEGMQQWYWNCCSAAAAAPVASESGKVSSGSETVRYDRHITDNHADRSKLFQSAAIQALRHHQERHPNRVVHKK